MGGFRTALQIIHAQGHHPELPRQYCGIGSANTAMDTLIAELNVTIEHHVKEERDELFPKARAALDLVALGQQLRTRQQELESATA